MPVGQVHHERVRASPALDATVAHSLSALGTLVQTPFVDGRRSFLVGKVDCEGMLAVGALVWLSHTRPLAGYALLRCGLTGGCSEFWTVGGRLAPGPADVN